MSLGLQSLLGWSPPVLFVQINLRQEKKKKKMVKMVNIKLRIFYHTHNGGIWVASVAL